MIRDMVTLEKSVIADYRKAIAEHDTDIMLATASRNYAEQTFRSYLLEWSDQFSNLYNAMYALYCKYTPKAQGHYIAQTTEIGYTAHVTHKWVDNKTQPTRATTEELLAQFDTLVTNHFVHTHHTMF